MWLIQLIGGFCSLALLVLLLPIIPLAFKGSAPFWLFLLSLFGIAYAVLFFDWLYRRFRR